MSVRVLSAVTNQDAATVHASCVTLHDRGLLITGRSGSGKSALALQMMGMGAALVSDDQVNLWMEGEMVAAQAPEPIRGLIEARGIGLLQADPVGPVSLAWVLDLDTEETARLPEPENVQVLKQSLPLLRAVKSPHFAASLVQLMKTGRVGPEWPRT